MGRALSSQVPHPQQTTMDRLPLVSSTTATAGNTSEKERTRDRPAEDVPLVSTIIPNVGGRRRELADAIRSVLDNPSSFEREVVVVNDSGAVLPDARRLEALGPVRIVSTGRRRSGGAMARNTGAFAARGEFLHFLDDDDLMMDGAFEAFEKALRWHPDADWIYGGTERWSRDGEYIDTLPTDIEGNVLAALFCGEWLPLQASLVRARLFQEAGGFDVSFQASEDMDLLLRMGRIADVVRVRQPVCRYHYDLSQSVARRDLDGPTLYDGYEKAMDHPRTLSRLRKSADTPHVYGKVVRTYLISLKRHAQRACYAKLVSRGTEALVVLAGVGRFLFHGAFWQALWSARSGGRPELTASSP